MLCPTLFLFCLAASPLGYPDGFRRGYKAHVYLPSDGKLGIIILIANHLQ